ncbi:MAG: TIGR03643 family protein [Deinococcales bacterium]
MEFTPEDTDRIIMMAWEDRTPFEAIRAQFGLSEAEVKTLMRKVQNKKTYIRWRERVEGRITKFAKRRDKAVTRHKSKNQKF